MTAKGPAQDLPFRRRRDGRDLGLRPRHRDRHDFQSAHLAKVGASNAGAADCRTADVEERLWNALVYDGKLVRDTPDGCVERVVEMPVKKVTSVMFGGPNLDVLYVTSAAKPSLPRLPADGLQRESLFAIHDLGVRSVPASRFGP